MRLWTRWLLWLILACLVLPVAGDDDLSKRVMRVYHRSLPNGLELIAENLQGTDLTVRVDIDGTNVLCDPPLPLQFMLGSRESRVLSQVVRNDRSQAWRCSYNWHWCYGRTDANHDPTAVYTLPYASGRSYKIVQGFHGSFSHRGQDEFALDFGMPEGTPVLACRSGVVIFACSRFSEGGAEEYYRDRVNTIRIRHDDGTLGDYSHFRHEGIVVSEGQQVEAGDLLGYAGHTGFAAGPHLHFLVYRAVDAYKREGFPIVFSVRGRREPVVLEEGQTYTRP